MSFKSIHSFEKRKNESYKIMKKYPHRVPIICEPGPSCTLPIIDKKKYLVPTDLTMGQFLHVIRKRIHLSPELALFVFIDNTMPSCSFLISTIYENHKDADGFLYITYSGENTFGNNYIINIYKCPQRISQIMLLYLENCLAN